MTSPLDELVTLLRLEPIGVNRFRGQCQNLGFKALFGGQVMGQSLSAACQTIEPNLVPHSFHNYFLRPGNVVDPIEFEVDIIRDGRSFATRRIVASQNGRAILTMTCSFQRPEPGFEHQAEMPNVAAPEELTSQLELTRKIAHRIPEKVRNIFTADKPFETRVIDPIDPFNPEKKQPVKYVWFKAVAPLPDDPMLHAYLLAYASDFHLIGTSLLPHGATFFQENMMVASIDHALWLHRPLRIDDWLLYVMDSPSASQSRGLSRGQLFSRDGTLVASVTQEGLIRQINQ